ncbi:MAG: hypothetical protein KF832_00190 [Caldilineaceae bacterium]|nr:hypothetical protein [Caldilineaceae bacterium]
MQQATLKPFTQPDRWSYLWLLISTMLGIFAFGYWIIPLAAWLGTVFTVRFSRTQPVVRGFLLIALTAIPVNLYVTRDLVPLPFPMSAGVIALQVLLGCLPFLADRLLAPRLPGFAATLVFPLAATAWEFINLTNSPLGSFGSAAYVNYGNLPLMQLAALTGIWGITFLMQWFATVVNWSWEQRFEPQRIWRGVSLYGAILLLVLAYGNARLLFAPHPNTSVRMAGITIDHRPVRELMALYNQDRAAFRAETQAIHAQYLAATQREAAAGAQLVNWPEAAITGVAEDVEAMVVQGQAAAQQASIYLAMSTFTLFPGEERPAENRLLIFDPLGQIIVNHVKYGGNFLEGTLLGDGILQTVATPFGLLSGVICWDADFVVNLRQAGRQQVDLLVITANDWPAVSAIHAQMAVFRAIENGTAILRQSSNGTSMAVDAYGRVLTTLDHFTTTERVLIAQMPVKAHVATLYSIIGDSFGWFSVIGFLFYLGWAVVRGRRQKAMTVVPTPRTAPIA